MTSVDDDALDSERQTADLLQVSLPTLRRWCRLKRGPRPTFIGRKIFYRRAAQRDWIRAQEGFPADLDEAA